VQIIATCLAILPKWSAKPFYLTSIANDNYLAYSRITMVVLRFTLALQVMGLTGLEKRGRQVFNLRNPNSGLKSKMGSV
jgi:hypothetical protein